MIFWKETSLLSFSKVKLYLQEGRHVYSQYWTKSTTGKMKNMLKVLG